MENTSNYGLKRWDPEDRILHTEFNDNWDKIDTALKAMPDKAAALQTALGGASWKLPLKPIPIPGPAPMVPTTPLPPPLPFRKNPQRCSFSDTTFLPC